MFILLSKLLPLFIYPLGLASVLLLLALIFFQHQKTSRILIFCAVLVLWLSSTTGFSSLLARSLEWRYKPPAEIPDADLAVVLGGGTEAALYPRSTVEINGAGDRVLYASELIRQGKTRTLLLTGGEIAWQSGSSSSPAQDMQQILLDIGIPQEALILESESRNTHENAVFSAKILEEMGIQRILLVTSALHMPRAVAVFEAQGLEVIPLPVDYSVTEQVIVDEGGSVLVNKIMDVIPSAGNLSLTTNALKEYIGMLVYRLRGWL